MARRIAFHDLSASAWKNGAGSTTEIAVHPAGAGLDDFDWRISLATIERSAPFSPFRGVDRSLAVVSSSAPALVLLLESKVMVLDTASPPLHFPGEAFVSAIAHAASTDFNVMTRRGRCEHRLERIAVAPGASHAFTRQGAVTLLFVAAGEGEISLASDGGGGRWKLGTLDALLLDAGDARGVHMEAPAGATVLTAEIFSLQP
jgi:environmental stress-induced protein Ves